MIYTYSKFNYGHDVTTLNQYISFDEGAGEILAVIENGNYTLDEYCQAVQDAMNAVGGFTYRCSVTRSTGLITISTASSNFTLRTHSGSTTATAWFLLGFNSPTADLTGNSTYTATAVSGSVYKPQFLLQSYLPPESYVQSVSPTINMSADGRVEVVRFGTQNLMEMEIKFITNLLMDNTLIKNNPNGLANARAFLGYAANKKRFEFVPDVNTPTTFYKVILEMTPDYADGTGFKLNELYGDLNDIYETGLLTLRVVP
jgi:hypothetical protein